VPAIPLSASLGVDETRSAAGASGPAPSPLCLVGLECSLETVSIDALEALAQSATRERLRELFESSPGTQEVAVLTTCHRVELFLLLRAASDADPWCAALGVRPGAWRIREGRAVVRHLFDVAAGHASLARGEGEVRHQVRAAARWVETRHPRPLLRDLLEGAADAAEEVAPARSSTRSIAAVAAARLMQLVDGTEPRVVVIGSGIVGRQLVEQLGPEARVTLLYHRNPPPEAFLRTTRAEALPLEHLPKVLATADAAVTAAKFGDRGLRSLDLPRDHRLLLIDLGMPRNIDPAVRKLANVRLLDLEDLHGEAKSVGSSDGSETRIIEQADRYADRLERLLLEPWIDSFRRAAEEIRRGELATAQPFLGRLDAEQRAAIDRLTQRLVARLLLPATRRLRALPAGPEGELQRRLAFELFDLPSDRP
jgi:glutamyl-tRNA reductase